MCSSLQIIVSRTVAFLLRIMLCHTIMVMLQAFPCNIFYNNYYLNTVFTRISAAALIKFFAPQERRLIEGGAYLKIGSYREIFFSNLTVYLPSVRKITVSKRRVFIVAIHLFRHLSVVSSLNSDLTPPSTTALF